MQWDTAGLERHRAIVSSYLRNADGILLVYDITNAESWAAMREWKKFADDYGPERMTMILVGNKYDKWSCRQVDTAHSQVNIFSFMLYLILLILFTD